MRVIFFYTLRTLHVNCVIGSKYRRDIPNFLKTPTKDDFPFTLGATGILMEMVGVIVTSKLASAVTFGFG